MASDSPVTDHALLRWIERQYGLDVEAMRDELHEMTRSSVAACAVGCPAGDLWAVIERGRVVTVVQNKPSTFSRIKNRQMHR
jgi:hypothetical protein